MSDPTPLPIQRTLPGDLVQITDTQHPWRGVIALVVATPSWGVQTELHIPGAMMRERFQTAQVQVVGVATLLPPEVSRARRDAVETWRILDQEAGR